MVLHLKPNIVGDLITKFGHLDIFDAEALGLMRSPLYGDFVVEVVP